MHIERQELIIMEMAVIYSITKTNEGRWILFLQSRSVCREVNLEMQDLWTETACIM